MSQPPPFHGQARFRRLADYLAAKAPLGRLPGRQHIDPIEIADLLPGLTLLDVVPQPGGEPRFRVRLAGTEVVREFGSEMTGRFVDELLHGPSAPQILGHYREVVRTGAPRCHRGGIAAAGREHLRYERLTLPLAADGERVDMLISVLVRISPRAGDS